MIVFLSYLIGILCIYLFWCKKVQSIKNSLVLTDDFFYLNLILLFVLDSHVLLMTALHVDMSIYILINNL